MRSVGTIAAQPDGRFARLAAAVEQLFDGLAEPSESFETLYARGLPVPPVVLRFVLLAEAVADKFGWIFGFR